MVWSNSYVTPITVRFTAGCDSQTQMNRGQRDSLSRVCFINSWVTFWCWRDFESSLTDWPPTLQEFGTWGKNYDGPIMSKWCEWALRIWSASRLTEMLIPRAVKLDPGPHISFLTTFLTTCLLMMVFTQCILLNFLQFGPLHKVVVGELKAIIIVPKGLPHN